MSTYNAGSFGLFLTSASIPRIISLACCLRGNAYKQYAGDHKQLLKQILYRIVPATFNILTIRRSSQCSTTGVPGAAVCAVLSVGWCI